MVVKRMVKVSKRYPCDRRNYALGRSNPIQFLVIHYTGAEGDAKNNAIYFSRTNVGASAHYFVGHGATGAAVYQSVADGNTAWHCGDVKYRHPSCRNSNSIGIELCCHRDGYGRWHFDPETVDAAAELAREIVAQYGIPSENLLRHYDVTGKNCPAPFVADGAAWAKFKARVFASESEDTMNTVEKGVSPWATASWQKAQDKKIMDGTNPSGAVTREQLAAVLDRLKLLE